MGLSICQSVHFPPSQFFTLFFFPSIQARLRRCQPPPQPWTSSSSSSRTIASKTWSSRLTCMPRSSRSALALTKAGVRSQPRRSRPFWALSPRPVCTAASRCSASGARASSATGASPSKWASHASRRSSSTSTSWLSGRHRGATRACTRSSPSWTRCSSRSAALSDLHRRRWGHSSFPKVTWDTLHIDREYIHCTYLILILILHSSSQFTVAAASLNSANSKFCTKIVQFVKQ